MELKLVFSQQILINRQCYRRFVLLGVLKKVSTNQGQLDLLQFTVSTMAQGKKMSSISLVTYRKMNFTISISSCVSHSFSLLIALAGYNSLKQTP